MSYGLGALVSSTLLGVIVGAGGMRYIQTGELSPEAVTDIIKPISVPAIKPDQWVRPLSDALMCELQERLFDRNVFDGPADGQFNKATSVAISKFEKRVGRQQTGRPTMGLLTLLRGQKVANRETRSPGSGSILQGDAGPAPLTVVTSGSGGYFIKVGKDLGFYVEGGSKATIHVPLGTYELKYATGSRWLSRACLFGIGTQYSKADETFSFTKTDNGYSGYTVELISQRNGNLRTSGISANEF